MRRGRLLSDDAVGFGEREGAVMASFLGGLVADGTLPLYRELWRRSAYLNAGCIFYHADHSVFMPPPIAVSGLAFLGGGPLCQFAFQKGVVRGVRWGFCGLRHTYQAGNAPVTD